MEKELTSLDLASILITIYKNEIGEQLSKEKLNVLLFLVYGDALSKGERLFTNELPIITHEGVKFYKVSEVFKPLTEETNGVRIMTDYLNLSSKVRYIIIAYCELVHGVSYSTLQDYFLHNSYSPLRLTGDMCRETGEECWGKPVEEHYMNIFFGEHRAEFVTKVMNTEREKEV